MKNREIKVPDIGDFDEVEVIEVLVSAGDAVEQEQPLITLESDKATMEVPATAAGTVAVVKVAEGDKVSQGDVIVLLEEEDLTAQSAENAQGKKKDKELKSKDAKAEQEQAEEGEKEKRGGEGRVDTSGPAPSRDGPTADHGGGSQLAPVDEQVFARAHASPAVRKYARELGVDLGRLSGSGPKGRILKQDVQAFVKQAVKGGAGAAAPGAGLPQQPEVDFSQFGGVETVSLSRIRKLSARALHRSWLLVPGVTQFDAADITELEAFRKEQKVRAEKQGFKLTMLAFLLKAAGVTLDEFPDLNASLAADGEHLIRKHYCNVGVAVDTDHGLVVPVLRDVNDKGVFELARELGEVSKRARDGKLKPDDLKGGCFSISSLGGIGGTAFTPIVNAPEVAILGVSRADTQPVWNGHDFVPRLILPLSLSYDHRVIDGAVAARITTFLAEVLGDIRKLLL